MSRDPVNIALLGAGKMGQFHADTIACHLQAARLVAVADSVADNAAVAAGHSGATVGTPAHALLANRSIDAVVIATPTRFHAPLIIEAARAGKHIFCEKPIALTLEDAREAVAAAAAAGVK